MRNKCFRGRCPYTDKVCKIWLCRLCRIEHREREYAKSGYNAPPRVPRVKSNEITFENEGTRARGEWTPKHLWDNTHIWVCSECGNQNTHGITVEKACWKCGADMRGKEDEVDVAIANGTPVLTEGDLISRIDFWGSVIKSRKETIIDDDVKISMGELVDLLDNAPTVDAILNKEGYEMYNKGYMSGYENCKKDVIHSIAKQYSEHNELVPSWLHIGNMKEADNDTRGI